ncbi:hypothetical protein M0R45_019778 [Rubus argutus]|uniref:Uncharacterized protein n=1 Tax=Rubus argutus TaxID=59490 RepID=A0AAW1X8D5_RUBAR
MGRRLGTVALMRVRARVHFLFLDLISFSSSALQPVAPFFWEPMAWLKGGEVDGNDGAIARIGESVWGWRSEQRSSRVGQGFGNWISSEGSKGCEWLIMAVRAGMIDELRPCGEVCGRQRPWGFESVVSDGAGSGAYGLDL